MSNKWFTADHHFQHDKMIELAKRPFDDIEEMQKVMIAKWNNKVKPGDVVYHLGDFMFYNKTSRLKYEDFTNKLNGKIIQILGNHDVRNGIKSILITAQLQYMGRNIMVGHGPDNIQNALGSTQIQLALCGHVHRLWKWAYIFDKVYYNWIPIINVGVDVWNFYPISHREICNLLATIPTPIQVFKHEKMEEFGDGRGMFIA